MIPASIGTHVSITCHTHPRHTNTHKKKTRWAREPKSKTAHSTPLSRMRSKGSRFTLGVWGLRVCPLDVSFTFATVRNRPQPFAWGPYGLASGKFCRRGAFWMFQMTRCFVSRGRRGTSWHSDVFCNVSKMVLCGRRSTFATFSGDALQFSWQAQHFGRVHRHFAWQVQHFRRVVLRVFCKSHWQSGDKVQIPWQAWHFVRCAKNWRKPRTKHRFWDSIISGSWELVGNVDSEATKCQTWRKSRTKCSFWCSHLSRLESLVFLWPRRVYGGSCKTSPFRRFPSRLSCHFAWQAWHFVTFQLVW